MSSFTGVLKKSYAQESSREYSRIISAAVINQKFCELLLSNPARALNNGFSGESFNLRDDERARVSAIHADTLSEFAAKLSVL